MTVLDPAGQRLLRDSFGSFPSGVAAIAGCVDGAPVGLAASSFVSVSLDPPLASVCVDRSSTTWPRLRRASRLGVSVLAAGQDRIARQLAGPAAHRFDALPTVVRSGGALLVTGSVAWFDCRLRDEVDAGDHVIALLEIEAHGLAPGLEPLLFHRSRFRTIG